jgi:SAM-dependent methyltransferase
VSLTTVDFRRLHLAPGQWVLDLGCGEGRHAISAWLAAPVQVVGVDPAAAELAIAASRAGEFETAGAARRLAWVRGSGLALPFADASFDRVICAEVLEHVHDYHVMLGEIRRVLKPGGLLAVSVPRFVPEWICWRLSEAYHRVEGGHLRIFRGSALTRAVEGHGLRRFHRHWAHSLHVPYWWLKCMLGGRGDGSWPVRAYHRFLVWDLMRRPWITRLLERLLDPVMGKSLVLYFTRDPATPADRSRGGAR